MDAFWRYIPLFVDDCSVVTIHLTVRLETICPDLSQRLGEVFSLLNYWFEIAFVVDATLSTYHTK